MSDRDVSLKELIAQQLPPGFVKGLIDGIGNIYPMSCQTMASDTNLGEEQASYTLGYYRRGCAETLFSRMAAQYGMRQASVQPENGGCTHVCVSVGDFSLVLCHVQGINTFPQHSDNREQSAKINEHLSQGDMFPNELKEASSENKRKRIFGVIIHSENGSAKDALGSIKIGFPNPDFDAWIEEPICLVEISDLQDRKYQKTTDLQAQVQEAMPKWRTQKPDFDKDAVSKE